MASDPKEPEKYSLDEMMERLRKRGGGSEPELVTRPDGTQVYKVRKRKRRTRQPHKIRQQRIQKIRMMQVGALIVLLMVLVTAGVGMFAYYNSSSFVGKLSGQIKEWTGAEVEFADFRMTPVKASAMTATMRWPEGGMLREFKLTQISAKLKITSFISRKWIGEEVSARDGTLVLGTPDGSETAASPAPSPSQVAFPFSFTRYRCENLSILFGPPGKSHVKCQNLEASFYRLPEADQLRVSKGSLVAAGWPELPVQRGLIEFDHGLVKISSLRLGSNAKKQDTIENEGFAAIKGVIDPNSTKPVALDVTLERFPFALIGGKNLAHIVDMRLDSQAKLSFIPGDFKSHELVAPFDEGASSKGVFIGGFPFLGVLNQIFPDEKEAFGMCSFTSEATGVLRRNAKGIVLENLNLKEKNFLALRGTLRIAHNGKISGSFDVGVAERLAGRHPSRRFRSVFDRSEFGFRWSRIELSGTVGKPVDNFKNKVETALKTPSQPGNNTPSASEKDLETQFHDLINGGGGN